MLEFSFTIGLKASGFRSKITAIACVRSSSLSPLFAQSLHEQPSQNFENLKQSQYNFKHFDRLHPHDIGLEVETDASATAAAGERNT